MNRELDLRALVGLLSRQAPFVAATIVLVLVATLIALAWVPNTYQAAAVLEIDTARRDSLGRVTGSENAAADNARVENEVEVILTDAVLMDVVRSEQLFTDPGFVPRVGLMRSFVEAFRGAGDNTFDSEAGIIAVADHLRTFVDSERIGLTYLISVSASSRSSEQSARLANAVSDAYIKHKINSRTQAASEIQDVITARLEAASSAVEEAAGQFDQLIVDNATQIASLSGQADIAETGERLKNALATRARAALLIELVQRNVAVDNWPQVAEDLGSQTLLALEEERAATIRELETYPLASAQSDALSARVGDIEARLTAETDGALAQLRSTLVEADRQAAELRDAFRTDIITRRLSNLTPQLDSEFALAVREGTLAQARIETLLQRQSELADEVSSQLAGARVVSAATASYQPVSPNDRLVLILAGILGVGLGVGLAVLREAFGGGNRLQRVGASNSE